MNRHAGNRLRYPRSARAATADRTRRPRLARRYLGGVACCVALALSAVSIMPAGPAAATATRGTPVIRSITIGHSVRGRPIIAYELGNPSSRVKAVLLGEMHGDEHAGVTLARSVTHASTAVTNVDLWVIPTMNPDGYLARTRQNAHHVDLNRNWPHNWARLTGVFYSGPHPVSEPETRAMLTFLTRLRPRYVVSVHQPLYGVDTTDGGAIDHPFRDRLAHNLGLPKKAFTCWSVCHGSMTGWFTHHLPGAAITVEFGWSPSTTYLTGRAARGIITAMGGGSAPLSTRNPIGHLDTASATGSTVHLAGWTLDPDQKASSVSVHVSDNGRTVATATTNMVRPDVNRRYTTSGRHGYSFTFPVRNGRHTFCLVQRNTGAGSGDTRTCRTITINGSPQGQLDTAALRTDGAATVTGWTFDPDHPATSINVRVLDNGAALGDYPTTTARTDINARYRITGNHGYTITTAPLATGAHQLCVLALNTGPNLAPDKTLGCRTVTG